MTHRRPSSLTLVRTLLLLVGVLSLLAGTVRAQDDERTVIVLPTTGVVDQIMSNYLREGIDRGVEEGAAAVVIELNTPGGSLEATREIVQSELTAEIPVMVWVGPAGARAASAGTFLTLAAHVASMAPATNIGAATPISSDGQDIPDDLGKKVMNDTIATITSIAEERGRPVEWAVGTVEDALSHTVDEALAAGAIDFKAESIEDLLAQAHGMSVNVAGEEVVLDTAGAAIEELGMNPFQGFLHLLSDPNIAFILFTLGFYGIFFELQNPNYVTGILGAFALILAFIGFGSLPLNIGGLLLIGLAVILFVLELSVVSGGLLAIGGLVAFALGASALYTTPGDPVAPSVSVAPEVILLMTLITALVVAGVVYAVMKTRRAKQPVIGVSNITAPLIPLGTRGEVRSPLQPTGSVFAAGEEWTARRDDNGLLERGTLVRVIGNDGMVLIVEQMSSTPSSTEGTV
ncbi:MAG: nodulation protein NfeD [Chloroflexota bacterium]|nr:nodulation protein NfeD [Chloroflexota bacterium]